MLRTFAATMAIVALVCHVGCKDPGASDLLTAGPPDDENPLTKDDSVLTNVYLVRDAAEAWAALNGGVYPRDTREELPDGRTLEDFLPNGELLMNPYTHVRNCPLPFMAADPGDVGYEFLVLDPPYGYKINGVGAESGVNIIMVYLDPNEP